MVSCGLVSLLTGLGWNAHWEAAFAPFSATHLAGRIRIVHRGLFNIFTENGEFDAEPSPKLRLGKDRAVTGDWVALSPDGTKIEAILPRQTAFVRRDPGDRMRPQVIAANADVAFLVMGLDLDYNLRRLERYLYLTAESGARPVIVLNKSDLCEDLEVRVPPGPPPQSTPFPLPPVLQRASSTTPWTLTNWSTLCLVSPSKRCWLSPMGPSA